MPACLHPRLCLQKYVHLPGIVEACLHCLYTGFFVIEAATYGLILEQKFHGVLQIVLINFYLVLLCLIFIRWNMDLTSTICHFLISILSFILTLFVGKLILMYIDYMERPRQPINVNIKDHTFPTGMYNTRTGTITGHLQTQKLDPDSVDDNFPKKTLVTKTMKLDPLIVILDISVYLLISISYIIMLLKVSFKLRNNFEMSVGGTPQNQNQRRPLSFYEINTSESSVVSSGLTTP